MAAAPYRKQAPLRVCPVHGGSYRSWKEGAFGPRCLADDRTRPMNENDVAYAEALGSSLLAWQRSLALELDPKRVAERGRVGGPFVTEPS